MVYSEVPNFSEPNPEYLALMNKPVRLIFHFHFFLNFLQLNGVYCVITLL